MKRRIISFLTVLTLILPLCLSAAATETEPTQPSEQGSKPIYTVEDLLAMEEDPQASYILMADLDMTGVSWKALDFSGTFDGNGHAILNLTITDPGDEKPDSCDGNRKRYETAYFGLFGTLRNAQVKNLQLLNVRAVVEYEGPVFLAGIAGYAENTTITGCTVTGVLELRAHDRMFGVGGVVGYGGGRVEKCTVDVTLINTDTNPNKRDEQFLGGIYATGFMDVEHCDVTIDGYISDHGYVHSGGIVGMYMEYPFGVGRKGYVRHNYVEGKITFFEDNPDRRAYCKAFVGEALVNLWYADGNTQDFLRDEKFAYDQELRPEMCEAPVYREEITEPGCENFGYTTYTCQSCGYAYTDRYTLREHVVTEWTVTKAPTVEEEGLSVGHCPCGQEFTRPEPKLEPEPTTVPATEAPTQVPTEASAGPVPVPEAEDNLLSILIGVDIALAVLAVVLTVCLIRSGKRR